MLQQLISEIIVIRRETTFEIAKIMASAAENLGECSGAAPAEPRAIMEAARNHLINLPISINKEIINLAY